MKKILFLCLLLWSFNAVAQPTIPKYTWNATNFEFGNHIKIGKSLIIPTDTLSNAPDSSIAIKSGQLYYKLGGVWSSTGVTIDTTSISERIDQKLPITDTADMLLDYINDANEGLTKSGKITQYGGPITSDKSVTWNYGKKNFFMRVTPNGNYGDLEFTSTDSLDNPDSFGSSNQVGLRILKTYAIPSYTATTYRGGTTLGLRYQIKDSAKINTFGQDFGWASRAYMQFSRMPGYTGRSVYVIGNQTLNDGLPIHLASTDFDAQSSTAGTNYKYIRGYLVGHTSYAFMNQNDTIENWVGFNNMGFFPFPSHIKWSADYVGGYLGSAAASRVAKPWSLYMWNSRSKNYLKGNLYLGDSTITHHQLAIYGSTLAKDTIYADYNLADSDSSTAVPSTAWVKKQIDSLGGGSLGDIATSRILGRLSSGTGPVEELTSSQVTGMLNTFSTSGKGLVPPPAFSANWQYLSAAGTWVAPTLATILGNDNIANLPIWMEENLIFPYKTSKYGIKFLNGPNEPDSRQLNLIRTDTVRLLEWQINRNPGDSPGYWSMFWDFTPIDSNIKVAMPNKSGTLALLSDVGAGDVTTTGTQTLSNKRWVPRVGSTTSSGTPTINTDNYDIYKLTAQSEDITSFTTNLTGTPNDGDILQIQITGTATRNITWGSSFVSSTVTLPAATDGTNTLSVVFQYSTTSSYGNNKWICVNSF